MLVSFSPLSAAKPIHAEVVAPNDHALGTPQFKLVQSHPLANILEGEAHRPRCVRGSLTLAQVATLGGIHMGADSIGLGTINPFDAARGGHQPTMAGELVIVSGAAWLVDCDGNARRVSNEACTPFAMMTQMPPLQGKFEKDWGLPKDLKTLLRMCQQRFGMSDDSIYAAKIVLTAKTLTARSVRPYDKGAATLEDVSRHLNGRNAGYILVGYYLPSHMQPPGWHFHALSNGLVQQNHAGGHVIDVTIEEVNSVQIVELGGMTLIQDTIDPESDS